MLKEAIAWIATKSPWWLRLYILAVVVPNLIVFGLIFVFLFMPWNIKNIHATTRPFREARDKEISSIVMKQEFHNQKINDTLERQEQHLSLIFAELIRRNNP